ncbi:hydrogenase expression/formation protein HypE [bacterium J17]|nr:hydrogenase expression/formation protein HypE [bacterium J17]
MSDFNINCPISLQRYPVVTLAHGGGGALMRSLIRELFYTAFDNEILKQDHDGALLGAIDGSLTFTTDSFVVSPLFFPGGDIGSLAVYGTVNDLAMCGAKPVYLSSSFIIEEGLPMEDLWRILLSMKSACESVGVSIVTGDTKVVEKDSGDGLFINTTGIGVCMQDGLIAPGAIRPGDSIILSGDIGRHGIAVMACREGLSFKTKIESDCKPLIQAVTRILDGGVEVRCLRDITRGGLATVLCEFADTAGVGISILEDKIPVREDVRGACEMLGLDPLYVACEGRFVTIVSEQDASAAIDLLREEGEEAVQIGAVHGEGTIVEMKNAIGTRRVIDMLSGEQLPRIC